MTQKFNLSYSRIRLVVFSVFLFYNVPPTDSQLTFARVDSLLDCMKYLVRFGYLKDLNEVAGLLNPSFSPNLVDPLNPGASALRLALSKFQQYARLPVSGQFDQPTKAKMNTPRCGNKDILNINVAETLNLNSVVRRKRYVTSGFKWQQRELTYRVTKFSDTGFPEQVTLREIDRAFEAWSNVTNLFFVRSNSAKTVDIELKFARLAHGDVEAFDGRGITLAHAFPPGPEIGGDIHFDDDEEWTSEKYTGTNFFHVVVHELGHALGLRHSDHEDAVMYAFARGYEPAFRLHEDDVQGIQAIYGRRDASSSQPSTASNTTQTPTPTSATPATSTSSNDEFVSATPGPANPQGVPDLCTDSKLNAITALADGRIYAFKGLYTYRIDPNGGGIMPKYTEKTSYVFYGLPGNIDAAVTYEGKTYFFVGKDYWRYENRKIDGNFPRRISDDFPGVPDNIDAAFVWGGDNQLYFFKGDKYWSFNPLEKPAVSPIYPLPISQWYGLPVKDINAAFRSPNGPTYFFKDQSYWLFDDENFQVAEADPPYPRSTRVMWLGCTPYRPGADELKKGWIRKQVDKVSKVVSDVADHFDTKIKKISGWFG